LTTAGSIWVGSLELDSIDDITGLNGPARPNQRLARVLVRLHGAPLGFVTVPLHPGQALKDRVQLAAKARLADALDRHMALDAAATEARATAAAATPTTATHTTTAHTTTAHTTTAHTTTAATAPTAGGATTPTAGGANEWAASVACPCRFGAPAATGITIVVCTRNRTAGLAECLHAIGQVSYAPLEILVVDNAPDGDQTRALVGELARQDSRIRYTCEPRPGLSHARNHGLAQACHDLVAFTDDDALVDPGWPSALVAGFEADSHAACVTGFVAAGSLDTGSERYFDSRYSWGEVSEPRRFDLAAHRDPARLYPFCAGIFGTGANFAVRRSVVLDIGGFDPLLGAGAPGLGGEDLDMFLRIILSGYRICYLPSAFVWHRHRSDPRALGEQTYSYGHGLGAYLAKHLSNPDLRAALARQGMAQAGMFLRRMRRATADGQLGAAGGRLALTEARGVAAGLLSYRKAARSPAPVKRAPAQT
jgi:GT2 family glycosyltransferase